MLASSKKNKLSKYFIIILSLLLFTSCSWFTSNDDDDQISFTITGNLTTNGAMPENYAQAMNARTALATTPSGKTIQYKVLLLSAEGDTEQVEGAVSEVASDGSSYSIKYTGSSDEAVQYYLRAVAYYMDGSNEVVVLLSPDTQLGSAVNLKYSTFSQDLEMRPATSGYGEVSLTITLDSATMCDSVTISDESHFQVAKSGSNVTISHKVTSADNPKLASGSYPVTVNFYKTVSGLSTPVLVYQFSDVINVFNNLTTNVWVDNGNSPHLTTDDSGNCNCIITNAMLEDFKTTNIYVDKRYDGEVYLGTYIQPYHSLKDAINFIEKTGNDKSTYTIHVKQVASTMFPDDLVLNSSIEVSKKITVEAYATVPGAKDGFYVIKSDESSDFPLFTVSDTGVLTFESNEAALDRSGFPTQGTKGIVLRTAYEGVRVKGRFIMKGGCITSCSNMAVDVDSAGSVKRFEMTGGAITGNTAISVYIPSSGIFMVHGKPYIYGNTNSVNLSLDTGAVMTVIGPFATGALIGVYTPDDPTISSPITITSGYGYQTHGYNTGVNPSKYFRSDNGDYGVTNDYMITSPAGEAVISPSGGNLSAGKLIDDIKISINKTFVSKDSTSKSFEFTATKDVDGTPTTITAGEGTGKISYEYALNYSGEIVPQESYYQTDTKKITFENTLPAGNYTITLTATYSGQKYAAEFDVKIIQPAKLNDTLEILPSGTSGTGGTSAKYIYFGDFPKTVKAQNIIIDETETTEQGGSTYYLGSDGFWYIKCQENPKNSGYTYSDSTEIGNSDKYFKVEPIKWRVLTEDFNGTGKWLILAEDILTSNISFYEENNSRTINSKTVYKNNYEHSTIRAYLNGISYNKGSSTNSNYLNKGFFQKAFSTELQAKIITTLVKNDLDNAMGVGQTGIESEDYICNNTSDKVFLLSAKEASTASYGFANYDTTDQARRKVPTDYALANKFDNTGYNYWMLRSPTDIYYRSKYVDSYFRLTGDAINTNYESLGVVPAMCIEPQ